MSTPSPERDEVLHALAGWKVHEALGLSEDAPSSQILVKIATLRQRFTDISSILGALQKLLTKHKEFYRRTQRQVAETLGQLRETYGPHLWDLLNANGQSVPAIVLQAAETDSDPRQALRTQAERATASLQWLTASRGDTVIEAAAHPSFCPTCEGSGLVTCDRCGGSGGSEGELSHDELAEALIQDKALRRAIEKKMEEERIPSWVKPAEYLRIMHVTVSVAGKKLCVACHGTGKKPCPRAEEVRFPIPPGAADGWVLRAAGSTAEDKPRFVRLRWTK